MNESDPRRDALPHDHRRARRPHTERRLTRSQHRMVGGVAGGIAEFIEVDRARVRWVFGLSVLLTLGLSAVVYLLLWALLPAPPPHERA